MRYDPNYEGGLSKDVLFSSSFLRIGMGFINWRWYVGILFVRLGIIAILFGFSRVFGWKCFRFNKNVLYLNSYMS